MVPGIEYRRYIIVAVPRAIMPAMPKGFEVRPVSEAELRAADGIELSEKALRFRLDQGMECLGAFRGSKLMGVTWLTTEGVFDEDELYVRFFPPPGAAWDTGLYVRPEARGGRTFVALWAGTAAWLEQRGLDWSMSRISDYNDGSWRAHLRMGARHTDTMAALRIGPWQIAPRAQPVFVRTDGRDDRAAVHLNYPSNFVQKGLAHAA